MTDEVDFAMKYSEERKRRLGLETRLHSLIHEVLPFIRVTERLMESILTQDTIETMKTMHTLVSWMPEVDMNVQLNIFDSYSTQLNKHFTLQDWATWGEVGGMKDEDADRIQHIMETANKRVAKYFDQQGQQCGLRSLSDVKASALEIFAKKVLEAVVSKAQGAEHEEPKAKVH